VRLANAAPTLAAGLAVSALTAGIALGAWVAGYALETQLGATGPDSQHSPVDDICRARPRVAGPPPDLVERASGEPTEHYPPQQN